MKATQSIMDMPISVEIVDPQVTPKVFAEVYQYFHQIDDRFSVFKEQSEISRINRGEISPKKFSAEMKEVWELSEQTKQATQGYFDVVRTDGTVDPSGLVKGWAIHNAAKILRNKGFKNFYVSAGGDIQVAGHNAQGQKWKVGIENPFNQSEIVKVIYVGNEGVATSGTYLRGQHIYNPHRRDESLKEIVSLTVIGPNIYEADRFATAAFAMGREGIMFIENLPGFEGYMINQDGIAAQTSGFGKYMSES